MPTENVFGGGATETVLHPVVAAAMICAIIAMLLLPRKYAMAAFLLVVFLAPRGQHLNIWGVHLFVPRILILAGWARIVWTKLSSKVEILAGGLTAVDKAFFLWATLETLAAIFLNRGAAGVLIYEGGFLWDAWGGYFLLRFLIQNEEDIVQAAKTFAAVVGILAVTMLNEKLRDQNVFGLLGGVPILPDIREGSIRAQGPFEHSILAGVFAATLLPFFLWLWQSKKSRFAGALGALGCSMMVATSASATPLLAYMAVILGVCFWPLRKMMRTIRWGLVILLIGLHLVMKAPVWFLIDHVDLVAGNSGYHRAMLIDTCIRHFSDWWLIGTNDVKNWGFDMWDLSNQFIAHAESGGLAALICFLLMISCGFGRIGRARKLVQGDHKQEWFLWFLGIALFSHIVAFFGISYFDQTIFSWFALFAMISAATAPVLAAKTVPGQEAVQAEGALTAEPAVGLCIQLPKSAQRLETNGKIASTSRSKKETDAGFVDLPEEARLQTRGWLLSGASPRQLQLGKATSPGTTPPPTGTRSDKWISLVLELISQQDVIADNQKEGQSVSLRPSTLSRHTQSDLLAAPPVPVPGPILASDAVTGEKPADKSTLADPPTSKSTQPRDKASGAAKPEIALPVPPLDDSARVDAILWKKNTEVTPACDTLLIERSQSSAIVSDRSEKSQAANPVRTMQGSASSPSLFEGSLTKVRALFGIKRVAPLEPASDDQPSILKSTHETPAEIRSTYNTALPQPLSARKSHSVPASNVASEPNSTEIPESTASVPGKTVDSPRAELRPRVAAWLVARRLQLCSSIGVAVLCIILAVACIGLGIAIGRSATKRAPNIASANNNVSQGGSSPVATTKGETLTSKPIASPDSTANNRTGSPVERITHGRTSSAIRAAPWTFSVKTSISPSPTPVDTFLATSRSDSGNSIVASVATSAHSNNVAIPVIPQTSPTASPDSRETVPLARDTTPPAQHSLDRVVSSHLIYRVEPSYPKDAVQQRVDGTVKIHVTVGKDGGVKNLSVLSGPASLTSAALDAAQYWRYMPALRNGEPVESEEDISVEFHLTH